MSAHGNKHIPINDNEKLRFAAILATAKTYFEKMKRAAKESPSFEIRELKIGQKQYAESCLACIRVLADMLSDGVTVSALMRAVDTGGIPYMPANLAASDVSDVKKVHIKSMIDFLKS